MDAGDRRGVHAYGNRADFEKPSRGPRAAPRARLCVYVSDVAGRGARPLSTMAVVSKGFSKEWPNTQQSTQNDDRLTFGGTIPCLALAPLPAVAVLVGLTLPN